MRFDLPSLSPPHLSHESVSDEVFLPDPGSPISPPHLSHESPALALSPSSPSVLPLGIDQPLVSSDQVHLQDPGSFSAPSEPVNSSGSILTIVHP